MLAVSFILVSTQFDPQLGGFYHVWPKQSLRTGSNTSGLSTVRHSVWVNQKTEKTHSLHSPTDCYLNQRRQTIHNQRGTLGIFTIGCLKTKHRQTHRQPHTHIHREARNRKAGVNQTNKHKRYIEGPKGVNCGPARLKTTANELRGQDREKRRWGTNKSRL